ncbi:MAG TPA: glycoside hydrolase, partial [Candidatus Binatia bacterium]|nr:glycoside hydrolase [Candidatus Binatia bacterium]
GFAVVPGRSERDQANWWARAVSTFLADPAVEHIGVYEIKDLPLGKETIGDEKNHFLGITRTDRTKKLAFHTVALLKNLLGQTAIAPADTDATVTLIAGAHGDLHHHLFKRADGKQVLFIYDKAAGPEVRVRLRQPGKAALRYELDGTATIHRSFDGTTLENIRLSAGDVTIFRIDP